jgi:hypothetical protein
LFSRKGRAGANFSGVQRAAYFHAFVPPRINRLLTQGGKNN